MAICSTEGDHKVLVDGDDTTPDYLAPKLTGSGGITLTVLNPGGDEQLDIDGGSVAGDHKSLVNGADTTPNYLEQKVVAGANMAVTVVDLGGGDLALSLAAVVPPGSSDLVELQEPREPAELQHFKVVPAEPRAEPVELCSSREDPRALTEMVVEFLFKAAQVPEPHARAEQSPSKEEHRQTELPEPQSTSPEELPVLQVSAGPCLLPEEQEELLAEQVVPQPYKEETVRTATEETQTFSRETVSPQPLQTETEDQL